MASELKLFHVSMTLDIDVVVLAENAEQAEEVGKANWYTEVQDAGLEPEHAHAMPVRSAAQLEWMGDDNLDGATPYGPEDRSYENGCSAPQLSIREYAAAIEASK